uniref:Alpha/beta hydrolase fold-3 domain-containing protein n=1 Tax=Kalanchoe fedtschenkoi TaxID=63787 RepID=A0A7N0UEQ1_KALFE
MVKNQTAITLSLTNHLISTAARDSNFIFSPLSIHSALALLIVGVGRGILVKLEWVAAHVKNGQRADLWPKQHVDLSKLFIAGDSVGGNITYNPLVRVGKCVLPDGVRLIGSVLVHPYLFGSGDATDQMWMYICPNNKGIDDPGIKPDLNDLKLIPGNRMLVLETEKDEYHLRDRGFAFVDQLKKSSWRREVDIYEIPDEVHSFHLNGDMSRPVARDFIKCEDIIFTVTGYFQILKDGRVVRSLGIETVPPGTDDRTSVRSKDIVIHNITKSGLSSTPRKRPISERSFLC